MQILKKLYELSVTKSISISYKLSKEYIYISYDENKVNEQIKSTKIQNRVLGIDLNPNYIGWSVVDWKSSSEFKVIKSGVYSFKALSDAYKELNTLKDIKSDDTRRIYLSNKRTYETTKVAENIINKAIYYKCQIISMEDLNKFADEPKKTTICTKLNETKDNSAVYIVKVDKWRALISVSDTNMENLLTLS